jgi:cytochrome c oxidase subunit IV
MASIIAGFLMHAFYETIIIRIILAGGVIWFLIFVSLTLSDYITRGWLPIPGK